MSIESVIPSNHLILCRPLLLPPSVFPSIRVFSNESALHQSIGVSASTSVLPMNHPGLISFKMDWLDLCSPRDSQKSSLTPQFKSINSLALSFLHSPTHPYITTRKTIALTRQTFVHKVMSLLFNMLSRLVIIFLPRSKCLLISLL